MHVTFDWEARDGAECEVSFVKGTPLRSPSVRELAERLGLSDVPRSAHYAVAIVGGGPAGLASAVYGASEGLDTLLIERYAPGGQAGMSSRIENYLGFPAGISGEDLADRAFHQAQRFGADVVVVRDVAAIDGEEGSRRLTLDDGRTVLARSVIIATGVAYRSLQADGCDDLLNRGVYYGAAQAESQAMGGRDIHVVGGGNSAGQAALNFSAYARTVTILIRAADLSKDMSQYLVDRVLREKNVTVLTQSEVAGVAGNDRLERVQVRDGQSGETRWVEQRRGLRVHRSRAADRLAQGVRCMRRARLHPHRNGGASCRLIVAARTKSVHLRDEPAGRLRGRRRAQRLDQTRGRGRRRGFQRDRSRQRVLANDRVTQRRHSRSAPGGLSRQIKARMSKLIYITNTSLDGYVEDETVPSIGSIPTKYTRSSPSCCGRLGPF